jgi:glycosyltransferase involved in cell wall biosynthesis
LSASFTGSNVEVFGWDAVNDPHRGLAREFRQLNAIVNDFVPDVVYLNGAKAGMVGRLLLRGDTPTAFSPHSWSIAAADGAKSRAALRWERFATRWTDVILAVGAGEEGEGRAMGIRGRYVVARNGVDVDQIRPLHDPERTDARLDLGVHPDETAVVCVGRLHRQKGQDILLAAWPEVAGANRRLILVGDGPLESEWRRRWQRPDVRFVGGTDRSEAIRWMQVADVVVCPSRWEGMALVPLESLAAGTPVITTDVTGAREAVADDCGRTVPRENPSLLAAALNDWLAQDPQRLTAAGAAARARAQSEFNVERTITCISDTLAAISDPRRERVRI